MAPHETSGDADAAPPLARPERITVSTCVGCGATGGEARCAGCSEHRLDLVGAFALETLAHIALLSAERLAALEPTGRRLACGPPRRGAEVGYRALRESARAALGDDRLPADEPPAIVTGWWCAECGNVDGPRPCIGVCFWRPSEWISLSHYERERDTVAAEITAARSLEDLLVLVAAVTPRPGRWAANWRDLGARAAAIIADHERSPGPG